ncbi:MAG: DNA polymerase Y family protein [Alphaproteobacteria bacterium]|nr:DNA polymerase Y family protein [Alphaproteobacteria bacterium]
MKNGVLNSEKNTPFSAPRRYLSLWFPYLCFERSRSTGQQDLPCVLVEKQRGALRLLACDALARAAGLRPSLTLAEARAIVPSLHVGHMDLAADHAALVKIAMACDRFTPMVALDGMDGLLLDITGCTHLYGGEAAMLGHITGWLSARHLTLKYACAGTPDCAHVLARFSTITDVGPGDEASAVTQLPVKALEAGAETTQALIRAGLKSLGDLASRPSQVLTARFGATLSTKLRRIMGQEDIRLTPIRPEPELVVEQLFAEPLRNMDMVKAALDRLIEALCQKLQSLDQGGRAFEASFFRADGATRRVNVESAQALREAKSLCLLFALRLETLADPLEAGFGFDAIRLCILRSETLSQNQRQLDGKVEDERSEAELVDRLVIRFGREKVLHFSAQDSHDPLRCATSVPVSTPAATIGWRQDSEALPRPLQIFAPPQPIEVMAEVPDGPPMRFRWRKMLHQVRAAEGPERIEAEWWRGGDRSPRDYYRVEDESGGRFWVFREGLFNAHMPRWFMQGMFA